MPVNICRHRKKTLSGRNIKAVKGEGNDISKNNLLLLIRYNKIYKKIFASFIVSFMNIGSISCHTVFSVIPGHVLLD